MTAWTTVAVTGTATVVVQGMILLPHETANPPASVVVRRAGRAGSVLLLPAGVRSDTGTAAALDGAVLSRLGGGRVDVEYRPATVVDVLRYHRGAAFSVLVTLLAAVSGVLAGISAYDQSELAGVPAFTVETAPYVLGLTFVLALAKTYSDISTALGGGA